LRRRGPTVVEREYEVTLLSDVAVTANAATQGGHRGLDYLPGSLFLGAAAARWMEESPFDPSFFLSGRVRFLDAFPVQDGQRTVPLPLSYHKPKEGSWEGNAPCTDPSAEARKGEQWKQWREGFLTLSGVMLQEVPRSSRMKTAVDRNKRRSEEGKLFSCESLPRGMAFRMRVQAEDPADLERVHSWFHGQELALGRSRSAEYGSVRVQAAGNRVSTAPQPLGDPRRVVLVLASDLALLRDGMPVLLPRGKDFGLPQGSELLPEGTFLRTRRYVPWNRFFNCRMAERQVLVKGSVLTFRLPGPLDPAALRASLAAGVGMYREEGLGQVEVNPSWVVSPPVLFSPPVTSKASPADPRTPLTQYLTGKVQTQNLSRDAFSLGLAWAKQWQELSDRIAKDQPVPGKAQWGTIREMAVRCQREPSKLPVELEKFCREDLRRKVWLEAQSYRGESLYQALVERLGGNPGSKECLALHHAAVEMSRHLGRKDEKKEGSGR
jgi:hypothetical protein